MTLFKRMPMVKRMPLAFLLALLLPAAVQAQSADNDAKAEKEVGCIKGDCDNGKGTLVQVTDQGELVYRGEFKNGRYHGFGRLENLDRGTVYKGYWRNGEREGRGTYWDRDGNVYIGQWKNDRRNGQGTQAFNVRSWQEDAHTERWLKENTENYTGEFRNDVFYGEGTYRWPDGTKYVGKWAANKKHGEGYFDYGNGMISKRRYEFDERVFGF